MTAPREISRPVAVPDWWDVFTFTDEAILECPDCGAQSGPLRDIRAAACWVAGHYGTCPA